MGGGLLARGICTLIWGLCKKGRGLEHSLACLGPGVGGLLWGPARPGSLEVNGAGLAEALGALEASGPMQSPGEAPDLSAGAVLAGLGRLKVSQQRVVGTPQSPLGTGDAETGWLQGVSKHAAWLGLCQPPSLQLRMVPCG